MHCHGLSGSAIESVNLCLGPFQYECITANYCNSPYVDGCHKVAQVGFCFQGKFETRHLKYAVMTLFFIYFPVKNIAQLQDTKAES